jgi:CAAX protease family protein
MKSVAIGCSLALLGWFILFSVWTRDVVNFWATMCIVTGGLALFGLILQRHHRPDLFAWRPSFLAVGAGSAVLLYAVFAAGNIISTWLFAFAEGEIAGVYELRAGYSPWLIAGLLLWIAPAEEIFWRGFVQHRLVGRFGLWRGILIAALLYAGVHVWAGSLMLLGAALVCGLFWGCVTARFRSLWPGIISHVVWDILVFVLLPLV